MANHTSSTPPPPETWVDTIRVLWDPRLRRLFTAACAGLVFVLEAYRFVSPFAFAELEKKRAELLKAATKTVDAQLARDRGDRAGVDAAQNLALSQLQEQIRAIAEEHVRYVTAVRKGDVDAAVKDYNKLSKHWPCAGSVNPSEGCMLPNEAADSALSQPRPRR